MATPTPPEAFAAKLKLIGLDDKNATDLSTNVEKAGEIIRFFETHKVFDAEPRTRMMVYNLFTKLKPFQHREVGVQYILAGRIRTTPQAEAAAKYLGGLKEGAASSPLDEAAFGAACGADVVVSSDEIAASVAEALSKFKDNLVQQRFAFNSGQVLGALKKVTGNVKWAEGSALKEELDRQISAMLGPKTEADEAALASGGVTKKPAAEKVAAPTKEKPSASATPVAMSPPTGSIPPSPLSGLYERYAADKSNLSDKITKFYGWIRRTRVGGSGMMVFIDVYDGSKVGDLKCVASQDSYVGQATPAYPYLPEDLTTDADRFRTLSFEQLSKAEYLSDGCAVALDGKIVLSPEKSTQAFELQVLRVRVVGGIEDHEKYPISKTSEKQLATLRQFPFMRMRAQVMQCLFRIASTLELALHNVMDEEGVVKTDPNILTCSDCEGAGETFQVTPLMFSQDEKGKDIPVGLTVSSQLPLEAAITGLRQVYTCQKSFRAEKSDTMKHLAEFLHIEYEGAFISFNQLLEFTERVIKAVVRTTLTKRADDLAFLESKLAPTDVRPTRQLLVELMSKPMIRIKHCDAVELIVKIVKDKMELPSDEEPGALKRVKLDKMPQPGEDLGSEHEKLLVRYFGWMQCSEEERAEKLKSGKEFGAFVFLTHWPAKIKSFYMKQCDDGSGESESFDLLGPRVGELIGGSMREWRHDKLEAEVKRRGMDVTPIQWFIDLRKSGSMPHGGWGLGFARLATLLTGVPSVRDIVFLPVYYGHCPY